MNRFYLFLTFIVLTMMGFPAFAQEAPASFDFMAELMGQIPIAVRNLVSAGSSITIIIAGGVMLAFMYELYHNLDNPDAFFPNAFKIGLGVIVLLMVWGLSPIYSNSLAGFLNHGANHPDAGTYVQVDLYYSVQRFSDSLAKVMFPIMDDDSIDAVASKIEKKTNVLAFSNGCNTEECFTKLKAFYNEHDRAPDDMTELYGTEMEDPDFGMTEIGAMLKYYAAKFINIGMIIKVVYFIFKVLLQIFLFMNNIFLTIIAQLTLLIFMFTSFQVLSPRFQGNFISSIRTVATVSLFNFALNLVNGLTMTLLASVDLTIGRSIAYLGGPDTSSVVLKAVCMVVAILVLYAISLKMIPAISQAITSGNLGYLNNLGEQLSNGVMAVGVAAAGAGLGAVPYLGMAAGNAMQRFWNSFKPGAGSILNMAKNGFTNWRNNRGKGPSNSFSGGGGGPMGGGGGGMSFAGLGGGAAYHAPKPLLAGKLSTLGGSAEPTNDLSLKDVTPPLAGGPTAGLPAEKLGISPIFTPNFTMGSAAPKTRKDRKGHGTKDKISFKGKDGSKSRAQFAEEDFEEIHETGNAGGRTKKGKKTKAKSGPESASSGRKSRNGKSKSKEGQNREQANFSGFGSNSSDFSSFGQEENNDSRFSGEKRESHVDPFDDILDAEWEDVTDNPEDIAENIRQKRKEADRKIHENVNKASDKKTIGDFFRKENLASVATAAAKVAGLSALSAFNVAKDTAFAGALNDYDTLGAISVNPTQELANKTKETWSGISIQTHREIVEKKIEKLQNEFDSKIKISGTTAENVFDDLKTKYKKSKLASHVLDKMQADHDEKKTYEESRKNSKAKSKSRTRRNRG
ncbi:hypothetical protein [Bdellovibrio sp. BCCA]|uniref:hypothetical protein n=1 Tax=Bdellovibrio sp. BCCA TaxID=3136281 RepID=UPI0030F30372